MRKIAPLVITLVGGLACYGLFYNRGLWLSVVSYSIAPAERVLEGEVPYRDFLFNYTPGTVWLNALLMKLFGVTLMPIRVCLLLFKVATLVALFYAARRFVNGWAALVPVALTLGWLGHKYVIHVHPAQYLVLFVLLGLIFMLLYDESGRARWLFASGLSAGVVLLFKHNVGVLVLASGTATIMLRGIVGSGGALLSPRRLKAVGRKAAIYWAGFACISSILLLYLTYNNAFGAALTHFRHHATEYSEERAVGLPAAIQLAPIMLALFGAGALGRWVLGRAPHYFTRYLVLVLAFLAVLLLYPGRALSFKQSATALVAYLPALTFLSSFGVALRHARRDLGDRDRRQQWWRREGKIIIVTLFALGLYLEVFPRADYYHLIRVLPPVFLLMVLLIARSLPAIRTQLRGRALVAASILPALLFITGVKDTWQPQFDSRFRLADRFPLQVDRARAILVSERQAEEIEQLVTMVRSNSSADDFIFSPSRRGSAFYYLAGRRNPTPILWWDSVGIQRDDREAVIQMIADRKMKLILIQEGLADQRLRDSVNANYHLIGSVGDILVCDRNQ